jgi:ankyrin repeat protein
MQNPEIAGATVEKQAPSVLEPEGAVGNPGAPAEEATPAVAAQPSVAVAAQPLARKPSTDAAQSPVSGVATGSDGEGGASPVIPVVRPTTPVPAGSGPDAPSEPQQNNSNSSETSSIPSTSPGSTGAAADDLPVSSEESVVQQQQQHSQHSVKKEIQLKDLFPGDAHSPSGITVFEEARTENPRLFEHLVDQATGRSALHFATLRKDITLVKWLVEEAHAHVNAIDHENQSVAHYAAFYGCLDILEFLKECHASMDVVDKIGRTLVTHAAMRGQCRVLMRLVEDWKMDINSLDYFGASALHWAAARGCVLSSKYLVQMGINVHIAVKGKLAHEFAYGNVKRKEEGLRIYKFLDTYISRGKEFLKMLQYPDVTVGGVESKIASWNKCFKDEWKQPIDIKYYRDQIGRTGLHHAAGKSPLPVLQHLVESCGFSITAEDYLKRLPLHNAGLYGREKNAMWLMKLPAVGAEQVLRLDKARAARNAGDGDRADSGHDESNVQIVRHWKKKSKSGKTAAEIATDGYSMGKHNKEMLGKSLADLAKSYGENVSNQPAAASSVNMKTAAEVERQKDVRSLLSKCKMDEHFDKLCEQGFESFDQLALMTAEDLQMMGVKPGHSRVIMSKVKEVIEVSTPNTFLLPIPFFFLPEKY